jgi:hypothetical protein
MPEEVAKAEPAKGFSVSPALVGLGVAVIAILGGMVYTLAKTLRDSPCFGHAGGEPPLVEVAKASAKLRAVPYDQGNEVAEEPVAEEKLHEPAPVDPVASNGKSTARRRIGQDRPEPRA